MLRLTEIIERVVKRNKWLGTGGICTQTSRKRLSTSTKEVTTAIAETCWDTSVTVQRVHDSLYKLTTDVELGLIQTMQVLTHHDDLILKLLLWPLIEFLSYFIFLQMGAVRYP